MATLLEETTSVPVATGTRGLWRAVLITPGQGSSGNWKEETIRRDGPAVLRKGAKCFVTHNRAPNGEPDPFAMWGTLASDSWYEEGVGLMADIQVLESWIDKVAEVAPHTSLSVFLKGERDAEGNITAILEDVQNGVDMVVYPGRAGSSLVEKLYESARMESDNAAALQESEAANERKALSEMEMKDLADKIDALDARLAAREEAEAEKVQANVDADAVADAVKTGVAEAVAKIKDNVAAVEAAKADLLPSQYKSLNESAFAGEDVAAGIEAAKTIAKEARTVVAAEANITLDAETGRFGESATTDGYVLGGFATTQKGA